MGKFVVKNVATGIKFDLRVYPQFCVNFKKPV